MTAAERKGKFKVEFLLQIEKDIQRFWQMNKIFEEDAPIEPNPSSKFMVTFPFPYMNGRLHLGHTFSISKAEFAVGYQRLKGKQCLFPFGFHCTGMPIKACADKLKREMEVFGYPPKFPHRKDLCQLSETSVKEGKYQVKKSKAIAKTIDAKYQWEIMHSLGLKDEDICKFADANYWLDYFPPLAKQDLMDMGLHVDWRRSFLTTEANPYFDSFVRWQFIRLRERNKDGQPCMDHDRSCGEGVGPQEYTLIKMRVIEPLPLNLTSLRGKSVFLVAATLRPETMYGQTNCWVKPDMHYIAFRVNDMNSFNEEIYISSRKAALNMAYQGFTSRNGTIDEVMELRGSDLIGLALKAPLAQFQFIFTLPMLSIKEDKGTGIITSVPSDSPDDFAALSDLKAKKTFRDKYNVKDEMVLPFNPIPIIDVPGLGSLSAITLCQNLKIQSQNDTEKLAEAKELVYLKGFYDGMMLVGEFKGLPVQEAKSKIKASLLKRGEAVVYMEPEKTVISRSGDNCVVALCDQWFLDYGETDWKKLTKSCLENVVCFHDEVKKNFSSTLDWLHEHACSRTYGLGTRLPWDSSWLIESLSDSTIYHAYYTVAHLLQGGSLKGNEPNELKIEAHDLTPEVWDYVFFPKAPFPKNTKILKQKLDLLKREFEHWYPVDLRVSGKDLVSNHLTYYLYNHTAIWPDNPEKWPKGIRVNGHLLLNSEKMSKSTGNFMTLREAIDNFSADGMRLALADAGDSVEDANFEVNRAEAGILRLYAFLEWVKEVLVDTSLQRSKEKMNFHDLVFENELKRNVLATESAYDQLLFREALRFGFFEMQRSRDKYREISGLDMRRDLILKFVEWQAIILSPICPHVSEYVWKLLGNNSSILNAKWPDVEEVDELILKKSEYLMVSLRDFRLKLKSFLQPRKSRDKALERERPTHATIFVAKSYPAWQHIVLSTLKDIYGTYDNKNEPDNKIISQKLSDIPELKKWMKKVMPFVQITKEKVREIGLAALHLTSEFDEEKVLIENISIITNALQLESANVKLSLEADEKIKEDCCPGSPFITFHSKPKVNIYLVNDQPNSGFFAHHVPVMDGDNIEKLSKRLTQKERCIKNAWKITFHRFSDPLLGPRLLPNFKEATTGKYYIPQSSKFVIDTHKNTAIVGFQPLGKYLIYRVEKDV